MDRFKAWAPHLGFVTVMAGALLSRDACFGGARRPPPEPPPAETAAPAQTAAPSDTAAPAQTAAPSDPAAAETTQGFAAPP